MCYVVPIIVIARFDVLSGRCGDRCRVVRLRFADIVSYGDPTLLFTLSGILSRCGDDRRRVPRRGFDSIVSLSLKNG
jgi:hypothetical protein